MTIQKKLLTVGSTAVVYFIFCKLNGLLFSSLGYSSGVDWIYLPSGLRLVFILLFAELGAVGIVIATIANAYDTSFASSLVFIVVTGLISGFVPLLARKICIDMLGLDINLNGLTAATLVKAAVVFAVLSPIFHQLWYTWQGFTADFAHSTGVMILGDFVGTLAMLYAGKFFLKAFSPRLGFDPK